MSKALEFEHKSFLDAFRFQELLPLVLDGRQHAFPDLLAHRVTEHFDVIEHVLPGFLAHFVGPAPDTIALERGEEAVGNCAVGCCRVRSLTAQDCGSG